MAQKFKPNYESIIKSKARHNTWKSQVSNTAILYMSTVCTQVQNENETLTTEVEENWHTQTKILTRDRPEGSNNVFG